MVRKVREGGWRWKCCWDAETVIQAAERGWHIWVHTHEHCESRRGSWGHWDTGHYTPASVPDQRREAWSDHRGPVTRPRRKPGEADGGAGQAGQAWATGVKVVTGEHWGRPEPGWTQWGSAVSSHHQAVAVRVTQDTHPWGACWALTLGHARGHGGGAQGSPSCPSGVLRIYIWAISNRSRLLFDMVIRNSNQSNTIIKLT